MRFVRWLAWLLVVAAQPAWAQIAPTQPVSAQASPALQFVQQRLAALADENSGEFGFAAMDLMTGETVSFNGNRPFPMASTMKIAVAAAYLSQVDARRRSLDDRIGGVSARTLMDQMITRSSNHATDQLIAALGGPGVVDRWIRSHGLTNIRVDRNIAQLLAARRDLRDIRDSSTPMAMLDLLRLVDSGNALSPQSRAVLIDMMRRCETGTNRMRALLPAGARVEHKTGTLNGYTSDVGFLTVPGGRRIAVAFFARYGANRPAVIATAARTIYDGFAANASLGRPIMQAQGILRPWTPTQTAAPRATGAGLSGNIQAVRAASPAPAIVSAPRAPGAGLSSNIQAVRAASPTPATVSAPRAPAAGLPRNIQAVRAASPAPASVPAPRAPVVGLSEVIEAVRTATDPAPAAAAAAPRSAGGSPADDGTGLLAPLAVTKPGAPR